MKSKKAFKRPSFLTVLFLVLIFGFTSQVLADPGREVLERRTLNSKTFDNGDGTFTFQAHMGHIHYVDKKTGKLRECDTTLIDMGDKWIQTKASYHCEIPKYADGNFVFTDVFYDKKQKVTMRPLTHHILGEIDNSDGWVNKRVLYRNAFGKGLHLRVTAGNVGLFKEIIIDKMPNPLKDLSFDFEISIPSEEHVYVQDTRPKDRAIKIALANHTITGNKQILIGQCSIEENAFSYIRQIRIWDSDDNQMEGRAQFYRMGSNLYFRKTVPKEFLATATYPVYTDDTASYYSGTGDGWVKGKGASNDWDLAHNRATGNNFDYTDTAVNGLSIYSGLNSNNYATINRGFLPIDATTLPDNATITAASLFIWIYNTSNGDNDGYDYIAVVGETTQASPTALTTADYDTCGAVDSPILGSLAYDITSITTSQYLEMVLNGTGISWIRKSGTGDDAYSRFGIREGHDIADHPYAGNLNTWNFVKCPQSDYAGTDRDPYLSVTYTVGLTTHYVDANNSTPQSPYDDPSKAAKTIQAAINVCDAGTVYVRKATYGAITMKSNVDVIGRDEFWNEPTAPDYSDCPTISMSTHIIFQGPLSNCSLECFRITGGSTTHGKAHFSGSTGASVTNVSLKNCWFPSAYTCQISLIGAVSPSIIGCEFAGAGMGIIVTKGAGGQLLATGSPIIIQGCHIHDASSGGINLYGDGAIDMVIDNNTIEYNGRGGIRLDNFSSATFSNNDIHNNGGSSIGGGGIRIADISSATIENNTIESNALAGIFIQNVSSVTITGNDIRNNIKAGVCIRGNSSVTINGNNDLSGNYAGVQTGGDDITTAVNGDLVISGNYIYNSTGGAGIWLGSKVHGSVTISGNTIYQNQRAGIGIRKAGNCTLEITGNYIYDNIWAGIHTGNNSGTFGGAGNFSVASTIAGNEVYGNGGASRGGGIDVRHCSGSINNNTVYNNSKVGIRFGDWITEITGNTVHHNGEGGIIYHLPSGQYNGPPEGESQGLNGTVYVTGNTCAYNGEAGTRACGPYVVRDNNTYYDNWYGRTILGHNYGDCSWTGWPGCKKRQLGGCWPPGDNEVFEYPGF